MTQGAEVEESHFSSVPHSMVSLIIQAIVETSGDLLTDLGDEWLPLGLLFFVFLFLTSLTIMNMLIGVMCEVMKRISAEKNEEQMHMHLQSTLQTTLQTIDTDFNDRVSHKELMTLLEDPESIRALNAHGVDIHALVDDA